MSRARVLVVGLKSDKDLMKDVKELMIVKTIGRHSGRCNVFSNVGVNDNGCAKCYRPSNNDVATVMGNMSERKIAYDMWRESGKGVSKWV